MGLFTLLRRKPHERSGFQLYGAAVAAARDPALFARLGVPDTLDGRFDVVGLHVALLIRRLRRDADRRGPAVAQAVFDAFFADMDLTLREIGVGDLSVGKKVRQMWEAFHGRARSYEAALEAGNAAALSTAIGRNVWRGEAMDPGAADRLAALVLAQDRQLAGQEFAQLLAGRVAFLPVEPWLQDTEAASNAA